MSSVTSPIAAVKPSTQRPRDAATLIIVDRAGREPRVLMGKRRMDQVFMPGKFVFPGGRADKDDRLVATADHLRDGELQKLLLDMKGSTSVNRARGLALAAIRETFEEAGLVIGTKTQAAPTSAIEGWREFFGYGFLPKLADLTLFARAITPPGRPRRYDTRFFCVAAEAIACEVTPPHDELSGVAWFTLEEARGLDLPSITRVILEDLADRLKTGHIEDSQAPVPFYHNRHGNFVRELLGPALSSPA